MNVVVPINTQLMQSGPLPQGRSSRIVSNLGRGDRFSFP
jgi:hypothetical protein